MQLQQPQKNALSLYLKFGALVFLLFLSVLIAACSSNSGSTQLNPPVATVTINLNQFGGSPTPPLKDYYCGGWATDTTPAFNPNSIVNVYGKVIHNVGGNPEGVGGVTATATIYWPDGSTNMTVTTTSDGLAVFPVAIKANSLFKEVLVGIVFTTAQGTTLCTVPMGAAFFTPIQASPTPTSTAMPSATPSVTPSVSPTAGGTTTPTTTPSPTPTTKPGH
jgi:hypothetical protein